MKAELRSSKYLHIASFIQSSKTYTRILASCKNSLPINGNWFGVHAEQACLKYIGKKYCRQRKHRGKIEVDLVVIRLTKQSQLAESRPCKNCLQSLWSDKFVKVRYVYYSTADRCIEKIRFKKLLEDEHQHVSCSVRRTAKCI